MQIQLYEIENLRVNLHEQKSENNFNHQFR